MRAFALQHQTADEKAAIEDALEIIVQMLAITPSKRPDAKSVFANGFFSESLPLPTPPHLLEGLHVRDSHQYSETQRSSACPHPTCVAGVACQLNMTCRWLLAGSSLVLLRFPVDAYSCTEGA
jgi:hypothetical protein